MNDRPAGHSPDDETQSLDSHDLPPPLTPPTSPQPQAPAPFLDFNADISIHSVRIGNYQLKRLLGSGGMGAVYEAVQDSPRRPVALKLMRNPVGSRTNLRRFQYESQLLARLRHPGIAEVYEAGTYMQGETANPFYTMEFIPGAKNIAEYARDHSLGTRQVIEMFIKACDAMHHAHGRGVIHRDLKPANILVDGSAQPKVIDFGIARALDSDQAPATLQTRADQLLGTLQYMSPEQLGGDPSALDPRSDVYSLGVILYELLCGRLPYDVSTSRLHEASQLICEQPPTSPRIVKPELSRDLETVLLTALHKDRSRRYESAQALGEDLHRVLDDLPIAARGDSATYWLRTRVRHVARRHRIVTALLAMAVAFLVAEKIGGWAGAIGLNAISDRILTTSFANASNQLRFVVIIAMHESTNWPALASEIGAGAVDPNDVRTLRHIHAAMLRKLIGTDARAVAFDIQFAREAPAIDELLADAAKALRQDKTAVVCAAPTWRLLPDGSPEISPAIAREVRWGSLLAHLSRDEPWSIDLFLRPAARPIIPSLTLAAVSAYWNPTLAPSFEFRGADGVAIVHFNGPIFPTTAPVAAAIAQDQPIQFMRTRPMGIDRPDQGIAPPDIGGQYVIQMPATDALERSTLDYETVLRMTADERRARLSGKLVFIGDFRPGRDGPFDLPDGRKLHGTYAHAAAAEAIISKSEDAPRQPAYVLIWPFYFFGQYPLDFAGVAAGALLAIFFAHRAMLRWFWVLVMICALFVYCVVEFKLNRTVFSPWVALLALPLAAELVALVERVRGEAGTSQAKSSPSARRSQ